MKLKDTVFCCPKMTLIKVRANFRETIHYPHSILYIQPLKMEPTEGSETSADLKLTPGKYPKQHIQYSKPDENLKSRVAVL